jgi:hypothetical protein
LHTARKALPAGKISARQKDGKRIKKGDACACAGIAFGGKSGTDPGQHGTIRIWRFKHHLTCDTCNFSVLFHKNPRKYIRYWLRFLSHLKKIAAAIQHPESCGIAWSNSTQNPHGAPRAGS